MNSVVVPIWVAFGAGLLSFVSPCTLPLFPSYIGYISGVSFKIGPDATQKLTPKVRLRALLHACFFSLGLMFLFIILGWGATAVGQVLIQYKDIVRIVGGLLIIVMGLFMAGVIRWSWLMQERRVRLPASKPLGYLGSVLVGIGFAAGWTPCIGPILSVVLTLTATEPTIGWHYMLAYAIGFIVPFLVLAVTLASIRPLLKYTEIISKIGGWLMVLMGLLLVTDRMTVITVWLQNTTGITNF